MQAWVLVFWYIYISASVLNTLLLYLNLGYFMDYPGSKEVPIIVASVTGGVAVLMLLLVVICASIARRTKPGRKTPPPI